MRKLHLQRVSKQVLIVIYNDSVSFLFSKKEGLCSKDDRLIMRIFVTKKLCQNIFLAYQK